MTAKKMTDQEIDDVRHAARMIVRELGLLADTYQNIGVTLAERHLLLELVADQYPKVGDIAARLLLDKSTTSRLIAKAVKKGFVAYSVDPKDKRRRYLQLTQKGRDTLDAVEPLARKQVREALDTLNLDEVITVQSGLQAFAKGLDRARNFRKSP